MMHHDAPRHVRVRPRENVDFSRHHVQIYGFREGFAWSHVFSRKDSDFEAPAAVARPKKTQAFGETTNLEV